METHASRTLTPRLARGDDARMRTSAFLVLLALSLAPAPARAATAPAPRRFATPTAYAGYAPALREADSLLWAQRVEDGLRHTAAIRETAASRGDRWPVMAAHLLDAAAYGIAGRGAQGEQSSRAALVLAGQLKDGAYRRRALRWLAVALEMRGAVAASDSVDRVLLREAVAAHDGAHEGYARLGLGWHLLRSGDAHRALPQYRAAVARLGAANDPQVLGLARIGLARTLEALGDARATRAVYRAIIDEAQALGHGRALADALTNLGALEYRDANPAVAAADWRRAEAEYFAIGDRGAALNPLSNLVLTLKDLGRFDEGLAVCDSALAEARRANNAAMIGTFLERRGMLLSSSGRRGESMQALAAAAAAMPADDPALLARVRLTLCTSLLEHQDPQVMAIAERDLIPLRARVGADMRYQIELWWGEALRKSGRLAEAEQGFARAESLATASGLSYWAPGASFGRGVTLRAMGRRTEALAALRRAQAQWGGLRAGVADPRWREREGARGVAIAAELADAILDGHDDDPARLAAAYDALLAMKGRTLLERLEGPIAFAHGAGGDAPSVTLAALRSRVLRPGELLLDVYASPVRTFVFAISPAGCRLARLPGRDSLAASLSLYAASLAAEPRAGAGSSLRTRSAEALSARLLGPFARELASARRVIVSVDGPFAALPLAELPLPGVANGASLGASREMFRVPSASWLARARGRAAATVAAPLRAWRGGVAPGYPALPAAAAEVQWLAGRFAGTTNGPGVPAEAALSAGDVLHFASHARIEPQRPWDSALLLGDAAHRGDPWLTAERVAAMHLRSPLVVLSGCRTARGQDASGEGELGLALGFLAAGAPCVVGTLWSVDDAVAERFTRHFYEALAGGATVAGSVAAAQRSLQADPATAEPFYWAGFVAEGDGGRAVRLQPRNSRRP